MLVKGATVIKIYVLYVSDIHTLSHFTDLLLLLTTDIDKSGNINYTRKGLSPFHKYVNVKLNRPGTLVESPAGTAIACSQVKRCDITWKIDLEHNKCPCAFDISCCANGVTFSFWWYWDIMNVPKYRYFLDFAGIYTFYNPSSKKHLPLSYRVYGSPSRQWWNDLSPKYGKWQHVVIMTQSNKMIVYIDGKFNKRKGLSRVDNPNQWFPGAKKLLPRFKVKRVEGNYSIGKLHIWENKQSALFVWRQHYDEVDRNNPEFW